MDEEIRSPSAKATQPLRHRSRWRHDEQIGCLSLCRIAQQDVEHVRTEVRCSLAAKRDGQVSRAPGEEMESDSERAGTRLAPVGRTLEIGDVAEVGRVGRGCRIDPEQLEIRIREKGSHRSGALTIVVRDGRIDDDSDSPQRIGGP
ncbi:MAG TPA: hypothetical protein VGL90_09140 [Casimicrobiaceae bacterium]